MQRDFDLSKLIEHDILFREAWYDLSSVIGERAARTALPRLGLLMIKPDGVVSRKTRPAIEFLEQRDFRIVNMAAVRLTRTMIRSLWRNDWRIYSAERLILSDYLYGAAEAAVFLVEDLSEAGTSCSARLSALKGPADLHAREPWQMRSVLGSPNRVINYVHTADATAAAFQETAILLNHRKRIDLFTGRPRADVFHDIDRIEADNPEYHFDFGRAAASLGLPDDMMRKIAGGEKVRFDTLLELCDKKTGGRDRYWDLITVAKEAIELDFSLDDPLDPREEREFELAGLTVPEAWQNGVRNSLRDAQRMRRYTNNIKSIYDEPAPVFRAAPDWRGKE